MHPSSRTASDVEAVTSFAELAERYSLRPELVANLDLCQCARARESALELDRRPVRRHSHQLGKVLRVLPREPLQHAL